MSALKTAVRPQSDDGLTIGGLVIPFGSKDLQGEYFDAATDLAFDWFPGEGRPVLFHHGLDEDLGASVVGRQIGKSIDEDGVWITAVLDKRSRYVERIRAAMAKGALSWSSGAMAHLAKVLRQTGRIAAWPWVEASLTPTPAHPGAVAYTVKSASIALEHIKAVGGRPPAALSSQSISQAELQRIYEWVSIPADVRMVIDRLEPGPRALPLDLEREILLGELRIAGVDV